MKSNKFSFSKFTEDLEKINTRINNAFGVSTNSANRESSSSGNSYYQSTRPQPQPSIPPRPSTLPTNTNSINAGETRGVNTASNHCNQNQGQGQGRFYKLTSDLENLNTRINKAFVSDWDSQAQPQNSASTKPQPSATGLSSMPPRNEPKRQNSQIPSGDTTYPNNGSSNSRNQGMFNRFTSDLEKMTSKFKNPFTNDWDSPSSSSSSHPSTYNSQDAWTGNNPSSNYGQTATAGNCLKCKDFSIVDAHAAKFPRQSVTSLPKLANDLTSQFPTKTEKARAIFVWLHHNIAYNTVAFFSNNVRRTTPVETVRSGLAVCQGYAELFADLGKNCGLGVLVISGHGKGYGYVATRSVGGAPPPLDHNHAWNAVRLDTGEWHLIDPCWGAGYLDNNNTFVKSFNDTHFSSSTETFRLKHFPTNPKHQFCAIEMSWSEYIMMKEGPTVYSNFKDYGFSETSILPNERFLRPQSGPIKFVIKAKCEHTRIRPQDQYVILLSVDGTKTPFQVDAQGTTWTCESRWIREGSDVSVFALEQFGSTDAKGVSVQEYSSPRYGRSSFVGLCKWDA